MKIKKYIISLLAFLIVFLLFFVISSSAMPAPYGMSYEDKEEFLVGLSQYSADFPYDSDYNGYAQTFNFLCLYDPHEGYHIEHKNVIFPVLNVDNIKEIGFGYSESTHERGIDVVGVVYELTEEPYRIICSMDYGLNSKEMEETFSDEAEREGSYIVDNTKSGYKFVASRTYIDSDSQFDYLCIAGDCLVSVKSYLPCDEDLIRTLVLEETGINLPVYVNNVEAEESIPDDEIENDDNPVDNTNPNFTESVPPTSEFPEDDNERLLGDVDLSGVVNVKDATLIRKTIADLSTLDEVSEVYADVDRNEAVNIKDATIIQKCVAGISVKESVGYPYDSDPETYRYYFYMPEDWLNEFTAKTGNTAGIYWWEGTNSHSSWPGSPAKKADIEGVYYYDVPKDVATIIWNNHLDGGTDRDQPEYFKAMQTRNVPTEYYDPMESDFYPEGTKNFDGMIYVTDPDLNPVSDYNQKSTASGEWFYYYGNGEYGTAPKRGESKILSGSTFDYHSLLLDNNPPGTYRYFFYMPPEWLNESTEETGNTAGIYWWEGTGRHDNWPGVPAMKADVEGVYYYDVPIDVTTIMWNNYFDSGADPSAPYYNDSHMTRNIGTEFYYPGEREFYPEGLENYDGMIYVIDPTITPVNDYTRPVGCGEWFYYYGNGEYGTAPVKGESKILTGDTFDYSSLLLDNNPPGTYRYFFYMPPEWLNESTEETGNTAGIYWWEGTGAQAVYPGLKAHKADAEGVYYCDVPTDVDSIIWNNYFNGGEDIMAPYYTDAIMTRELFLDGYGYENSELFPDGFDPFDSMIFVTDFNNFDFNEYTGRIKFGGEWFYYYGNGEYGISPVKGESKILTGYALNIPLPHPLDTE